MAASLAVAVLMLVGKLTAYFLTGSDAILSDAAESVVHIAATGMAAFSLWLAAQPACRDHLYGHGKIAYFSAGFEGALILAASLFIIYAGAESIVHGPHVERLGLGVLITGGLGLVNLALGVTLVRVGRKRNALILVANGKHVLTDMWTSAGVVVGVSAVWIGTRVSDAAWIVYIDPVVAVIMGLNILISGAKLMRESYMGLMDVADPKITDRLVAVLQDAKETGLISGYHQLRHRRSNDQLYVEVHFLLCGSVATAQAHRHVTLIEEWLREAFPEETLVITSHVEPDEHDRAHPGGHLRKDPFDGEKKESPESQ